MKNCGKIAVYLAGGLVLNASLYISSGATPGNPYEAIVTRNVFNLNPPQKVVHNKPPQPPSKITVDGLMTIFGGKPEAVYKVAVPPHPPHPAAEKHYILGEGQGQDDIEVKHIDMKNGVVTFNNHGVVQQIPLVKAGPITTPTPVVMKSGHAPPHGARGVRPNPRQIPSSLAARMNQLRNSRTYRQHFGNDNGTVGAANGSSGYGTSGGRAPQQNLTPEQQMLMIAAQHAHYQQTGNPIAKIFPPTALDKAAGVVPNPPQPPQPPQGSR